MDFETHIQLYSEVTGGLIEAWINYELVTDRVSFDRTEYFAEERAVTYFSGSTIYKPTQSELKEWQDEITDAIERHSERRVA